MRIQILFVSILLLASPHLFAASSKFMNVESIFIEPARPGKILRYAINVASYTDPINKNMIKVLAELKSNYVYTTKVKVNNVIYYRLVLGNFDSLKQAKQKLQQVKKYYPSAWLNLRQKVEKKDLSKVLAMTAEERLLMLKARAITLPKVIPVPVLKIVPVQKAITAAKPVVLAKQVPAPVPTPAPVRKLLRPKFDSAPTPAPVAVLKRKVTPDEAFADKLLEQARQLFLDRNYARVIAVSNKVIEIGSDKQKQRAMEYIGIARERQRKFAQAVAIYSQFLELYPESKIAPRIKIRLTGLKTMRMDPKIKIAKNKRRKDKDKWNIFGSVSQYYRDDVLETDLDTEEINSSLVSDVNMVARRKTDESSLVLRFDGGLVNDFIDNESDSRISRALVNYTDNEHEFQLIGGRQSRTAKGVLGRFDGLVYKGLSHDAFEYSVFTGFPVQSSFDSVDADRLFYGTSVNFKPYDGVDMDVYLISQEIFDLTDRQAIGTEFQYRSDKGFVYGIIDYDLFYNDINNVTAITNYRYTDKLVFNVTYDFRNSPLLTTLNALQGLSVSSIEDLQNLLSDDEIYQLAEDRTSKSQNLFIGSNYQIDTNRQVNVSLSISSIESTVASDTIAAPTGTVPAAPDTEDFNFSVDYSEKGLFSESDYTTLGVRLSDTSSAEIISLRARSRITGSKSLRYDPRLRLDYRQSKTSEVNQTIIKPSFKITYKPTKNLSFEGSFGIEYSNFDLPELSDQTQYDLFIGYVYRF